MANAPGVDEIEDLTANGFSSEEIAAWRQQTVNELSDGGFSQTEIGEYFGEKNPDMSGTEKMVKDNFAKHSAAKAVTSTTSNPTLETLPGQPPKPMPKPGEKPIEEADSFLEALEAGFELSNVGMIGSGVLGKGLRPNTILPEHAPMFHRIASQVGQISGDIPSMIVGAIGGGIGGASIGTSVAPGPGTAAGAVIGAGAGGNALPTAIRETLMQHYEKGDIQDFGDFWERASVVFLKTLKDGAIGGVTAGVGGKVGKVLGAVATPVVRNTAVAASEVATMVTVGKALEGEAPQLQDFTDAAVLVTALTGSTKVAGKLRKVYAKTGVKPEQISEHSLQEPTVKQELLSNNIEVPKAYEELVQKTDTEKTTTTLEARSEEVTQVIGGKVSKLEVEPFKFDEDATVITQPDVTAVKPEPSAVESASKKILGRIGEETPRQKEPITANDLYRDWVDAKDPLNVIVKMTDKNTPLESNPYVQARVFVDHANKAKHWFEHSPVDYATNQPVEGVKPLGRIAEPFKTKAELNQFEAYLISKRAIEIEASGRKTGVPLEEANVVVKAGKKQFDAMAKEAVKYNNQLSQYMVDAGFLTPEGHAAMVEQGQAYVPMYKIVEKTDGSKGQPGRGLFSPFKKLKGSEAEIVSPLESMAKNTALFVKRGEQNRAIISFVEFAEVNNLVGGEFIKKSERVMKKTDITKDVNKFLDENGIDATAENVAIYRPEALKLGENDVVMFRNGKMEVYEMHPDIAKIYRDMDGSPAAGMFVKLLKPFASVQRATIAITPDFILRNKIRDEITAGVFSKYKSIPVYDSLVAMGDIVGKSEHYQGWLRSGGGNGSFLEIDSAYIQKDIYKINRETGFMDNAINVIKSPLEAIHVVSNLIENSTRVAAYKNALKGKDVNKISLSESLNAGMQSREITVDFARMGAKAQAINQITAYWNVGIQGMDRTARAFKDNPVGTSARAAAYVTLPSVLLWWANKDDPRWQEIPRWQKDAFWIVFTEKETYRIPKPMELGIVFGSLPERVLEKYFTDNPEAMKDFDKTMMGFTKSFVPIPTGLAPVIEHWSNKSLFTGNPVIPSRYEGLFPEYQFNEHTSESAKFLAKFISAMPGQKDSSMASPMVIENYVRGWSGNTGLYVLAAHDKMLEKLGVSNPPPKPTSTLADIPFIKAFAIKYPSSNTQSIVDFEERFREQDTAVKTIKYLAKQGDFDAMDKEMELASRNGDLEKLEGYKKGITNMNAMIQQINRDPSMTPDEKRQEIDGLYHMMIEAAQDGREIQREISKDLGTD